jgi:signal transduction histidine kinase
LGLSIVQAICRAHGGTVSVSSAEGRGTAVQVRLPGAELAHPPSAQEQAALR